MSRGNSDRCELAGHLFVLDGQGRPCPDCGYVWQDGDPIGRMIPGSGAEFFQFDPRARPTVGSAEMRDLDAYIADRYPPQ